MKNKNSYLNRQSSMNYSRQGFTLIELLISSVIMLVVILATLSVYTRSNKVSVDQQQYAELQHDVRFAMFFISRDLKSIGAGLPLEFAGYFLQGVNNDPNQSSAPVQTDRLTILGNSDPLRLAIQNYSPGSGTITLDPDGFDFYPYTATIYPADAKGYLNRTILILPNSDLNTLNGELGQITGVDLMANQIMFNRINVSLPNGLVPGGDVADYSGGTVNFIEFKTYWLDVDGNYPGLTAGLDGYVGEPGVLYVSQWSSITNAFEYQALAQNIEDLQFQYHGDLDGDLQLDDNNGDSLITMDDFQNWDEDIVWTDDPQVVEGIRSVRIWILGRTERAFVSISGTTPDKVKYIYGKPLIADSPAGAQADKHRRFLLESTANVRNMSLSVYNSGT